MFKFFSFHISNSQIWLNWLINYHNLGYITKLKKIKKSQHTTLAPNGCFSGKISQSFHITRKQKMKPPNLDCRL
jgi:hypothetical protein